MTLPSVWLPCLLLPLATAAASELRAPCIAENLKIVATVELGGDETKELALPAAHELRRAIAIVESGIDVLVTPLTSDGRSLAFSDNPIARDGVQIVSPRVDGWTVTKLRIAGKEHAGLRGRVAIGELNVPSAHGADACLGLIDAQLRGDRAFGAAQAIALRQRAAPTGEAERALAVSRANYTAARRQVAPRSVRDTAAMELTLAAVSYYGLEQWQIAADWARASKANFMRARQPYAAARAGAILAASWLEIATAANSFAESAAMPDASVRLLDRARAELTAARARFSESGDRYQVALQVNNIGLAYLYQADFDRAVPIFEEARLLFAGLGEEQRVGLTLQNIAIGDWGLGRLSAATVRFERALAMISPRNKPYLHLHVLNNLGLVNYAAGRFDAAQASFARAYEIADAAQFESFRARALYGMAVTQYALGERAMAEPLLQNVLAIWSPQLDARGRVAALRALAVIKREQGQAAAALQLGREALALAAAPSARGRILIELADTHLSAGEADTALQLLEPLATAAPSRDRLLTASAWLTRATARSLLGQHRVALLDLERALPIFRETQDVNNEFRCFLQMARALAAMGQPAVAAARLEQGLALSDDIRSQTANPEYRASLATQLRSALELRLQLFWAQYASANKSGNPSQRRSIALQALAAADATRGLVLDELRAQGHSTRQTADSTSDDGALRASLRQIAELRYQLAVRYDRGGSDDREAQRLRASIVEQRARLNALARRLPNSVATVNHRRTAVLRRVSQLGGESPATAFIEYWIGENSSFAWVVRGSQLHWLQLGKPAELQRAVEKYNSAFSNSAATPRDARKHSLQQLDDFILQPLQPLLGGAQDLVFVPDGALATVSFAVLLDRTQPRLPFLIQRYDIGIAASLGASPTTRRSGFGAKYAKDLLILADPVYEANDPRFASQRAPASNDSDATEWRRRLGLPAGRRYHRLVASGAEAARIAGLVTPDRVDLLTGFAASRSQLLNTAIGDYRFVHIAAHAFVDLDVPQLSAALLSRFDRRGEPVEVELRPSDFLSLSVNAEAVVLSSCVSASGRRVDGEGVMGLQYAALAAGAQSVIASFWEVSDEITARLMTETYRGMLSGGKTPRQALGSAIRQLLLESPQLDPASWGAFATYIVLPPERHNDQRKGVASGRLRQVLDRESNG